MLTIIVICFAISHTVGGLYILISFEIKIAILLAAKVLGIALVCEE